MRIHPLAAVVAVGAMSFLPPAKADLVGLWDFSTDLSATVGSPIQYRGDTAATTTFTTSLIGGQPAQVMAFPATSPTQGYVVTHGAAANGGGLFVNQYTLVMDVMFPTASSGVWRSLWQTDTANAGDGDLFANTANGIGISSQYHGILQPDTWHRVAFAFDLTANLLNKYVDGQLVNAQTLSAGVDGRWSLGATALLFTDEDNETAAGFINSLGFYDSTLSSPQILALGGATVAGVPEPSTVALLLAGGGLLALRMGRKRGSR
jgi:hypothetical protein